MAKEWSQDVRRMAAKLQQYNRMCEDETTGGQVPIPRFVLIGLQSIGKTRLLSIISRRKLGGAEKNKTGTRCPVVYSFEPADEFEFQVGYEWHKLQRMDSPTSLSDFLTKCMSELETKESKQHPEHGFSKKPVHVSVKGPDLPSFELVDLPGLKKVDPNKADFDAKCNEAMKEMYKQYFSDPNTVPILLTQFETNLDTEQSVAAFNAFLKDAGISKDLSKKGLILITRLDAVRHVKSDNVKELLVELKHQGFQETRIVLASLKPELFGQKDDAEDTSDDNYFSERFIKHEGACLTPWVQKRKLDKEGRFGLGELFSLLEADLSSSIMKNQEAILKSLIEQLEKETRSAQGLLQISAPAIKIPLDKQISWYAELCSDATVGAATCDPNPCIKEFIKNHPGSTKRGTVEIGKKILEKTAMTFKQERSLVEMALAAEGREHDGLWLWSDELHDLVSPLHTGKDKEPLQDVFQDEEPLGGSAAVDRVLMHFASALVLYRLSDFTDGELLRLKGGNFSREQVNQREQMGLVRRMMESMQPPEEQLQSLCMWCTEIYAFQARQVCKLWVDESYIGLLGEHPRLQDLVNHCVKEGYQRALHDLSAEALRRVTDINNTGFSHLDPGAVMFLQTLTNEACRRLHKSGCIDFPKDKSGANASTTSTPQRAFEHCVLEQLVHPPVLAFKDASTENFNEVAHAFTQFKRGFLMVEVKAQMHEGFVSKVPRIAKDAIAEKLKAMPKVLRQDKHKRLWNALTCHSDGTMHKQLETKSKRLNMILARTRDIYGVFDQNAPDLTAAARVAEGLERKLRETCPPMEDVAANDLQDWQHAFLADLFSEDAHTYDHSQNPQELQARIEVERAKLRCAALQTKMDESETTIAELQKELRQSLKELSVLKVRVTPAQSASTGDRDDESSVEVLPTGGEQRCGRLLVAASAIVLLGGGMLVVSIRRR